MPSSASASASYLTFITASPNFTNIQSRISRTQKCPYHSLPNQPHSFHRTPLSCKSSTPSQDEAMRGYLDKVRKRLRHSVSDTPNAAQDYLASKDSHQQPSSPTDLSSDLDEIDDLIMDRGPAHEGRVKLFGAWLDDNVAGRKAVVDKEKVQGVENSQTGVLSLQQKGRQLFEEGMAYFVRGNYPKAAIEFQRAVVYANVSSREGGEYQLWLAQSYDAAGDRTRALAALTSLSTHRDGDVRKVAGELKFIISAPRLQHDRNSFLEIPDFNKDFIKPTKTRYVLGKSLGLRPHARMKKSPEKYSLDWYLAKPVHHVEQNSGLDSDWMMVLGLITAFAAFLASVFPGAHHIPIPVF